MASLLNALYLLLILLASPWLLYARWRQGKYREGFAEKVLGQSPVREGDRTCIWLHAVSVGEVNLIEPLLKHLVKSRPDWDVVISSTTKTGFDLARKKFAAHSVFYCPLDFSWAVRESMRRIRPTVLVLAELEIWPNLVRAAKEHDAKIAVVNGRLSERSFKGYRRVRFALSRIFASLDLIAAQNDTYAERFRQLGAHEASVRTTGSLKFDGAETNRLNAATVRLRRLAGIQDDDIVFLAGSTQEPEDSLALAAFQKLSPAHPSLRLILVPRHPERFDSVARMLDASGVPWLRRSRLVDNSANATGEARVLLVDTIGELGAWWGAADIAFVGGSLGDRGGQNMIEPAAYGAAVSFGPNTRNFKQIVATLLEGEAAEVVHNGADLARFVERCLCDRACAEALGARARSVVQSHLGATERTLALLLELVASPAKANARAA